MKLMRKCLLIILIIAFHQNVYGREEIQDFQFLETEDFKEITRDQVIDLLKEKGIVLLRGFDLSVDDFIRFSNQFSDHFIPYVGGAIRPTYQGDSTVSILSEKDGHESVYFHGEQYYQKVRPTTFWMYCLIPPYDDSGRTLLCDGRKLYGCLSDKTRKLFEKNRLQYSRLIPYPKWKLTYNVETFEDLRNRLNSLGITYQLDQNQNLKTSYIDSAIHEDLWNQLPAFINSSLVILEDMKDQHPANSSEEYIYVNFENGEEIPVYVLEELKSIIEQIKIPIAWRKGDILIFDNTRVMHAREGFQDSIRREIVTRFSIREE